MRAGVQVRFLQGQVERLKDKLQQAERSAAATLAQKVCRCCSARPAPCLVVRRLRSGPAHSLLGSWSSRQNAIAEPLPT